MSGLYARHSDYLDRYVQLGLAGDRLISVSFPTSPDADADGDHALLDRLFAYLEGVEDDFREVEIGLTVPTTHRNVLEQVREIPYGDQLSVEALARITPGLDPDDPDDLDEVRTALAENPLPLVVPDHRVRDGPSAAPPEVEQKLRALEDL
ncbi:MGMT family protein [Salarchaeum japonicum]|uniref:MGMT family protein n=1 Tax=Salarchaeum japonicum TaxID=555573 RepID=A0AAV3T2F1_9EURY|nr:MGMT family protein [Salarchaeum japonicum]